MKNTLIKLGQKLNEYGDAYFKTVATNVAYPYMKYNFLIPATNYSTQTGDFTVDVYSDNVAEVIDLADSVWKGLNGYCYADGNTSLYVRQTLTVTTEDENHVTVTSLTFQVLFEEE